MSNLRSLDRYKHRNVEQTLKEISHRERRGFKPSDQIIKWIDAQFEEAKSPLSKLFARSRLDNRRFANWKFLLWVLADSHYQSKRRTKLEFPEKRDFDLLVAAAKIRTRRYAEIGQRLTIPEIAERLKATKKFGQKTVQGNKQGREAAGIATQLKETAAKYRRLLKRPTMVFEDEFTSEDLQRLERYLFVLSDRGQPPRRRARAKSTSGAKGKSR